MNTAFSFGSYYPANSIIHQIDPRAKLLLGLAFLIIVLCAQNFAGLGFAFIVVAALYALSYIPAKQTMKSLAPLLFIVVIASILNLFLIQDGTMLVHWWFITITTGGVYSCTFIATRLLLMMMGMSLITLTTTTIDITEAFERLLRPFERIGLPAHELGMIMGIALRFMPLFAQEFVTIYRAQISRGARVSQGPIKTAHMLSSLMIPIFTSAFRHAETLSQAMDARCYHGSQGRTRLHPLHFKVCDYMAFGMAIVMAACITGINIIL